jgi:hypothetical protein
LHVCQNADQALADETIIDTLASGPTSHCSLNHPIIAAKQRNARQQAEPAGHNSRHITWLALSKLLVPKLMHECAHTVHDNNTPSSQQNPFQIVGRAIGGDKQKTHTAPPRP